MVYLIFIRSKIVNPILGIGFHVFFLFFFFFSVFFFFFCGWRRQPNGEASSQQREAPRPNYQQATVRRPAGQPRQSWLETQPWVSAVVEVPLSAVRHSGSSKASGTSYRLTKHALECLTALGPSSSRGGNGCRRPCSLLSGEDEDSPLGLSSIGPNRPSNLGLSIFLNLGILKKK